MSNNSKVDLTKLFRKLQFNTFLEMNKLEQVRLDGMKGIYNIPYKNISTVIIDTKGYIFEEGNNIFCVREAFLYRKNYLAILIYSKDTGEISQYVYSNEKQCILDMYNLTYDEEVKDILDFVLDTVTDRKLVLEERKIREYEVYDATQSYRPMTTINPVNKPQNNGSNKGKKGKTKKRGYTLKSFTPTLRMLPHHFVASKKATEYAESLGITLLEGFTIVKH